VPQVFVSHSRHDEEGVSFLSKAAAGSSVRLIFMELEKLVGAEPSPEGICKQIDDSAALFVVLSRHVAAIPHTRDWVVWEAGNAKNKDIWVFESAVRPPADVVVPSFRHYALYLDSPEWQAYVRQIIDSYSSPETLPSVTAGTGIGAVWGPVGATLGGIAGWVLSSPSRKRPSGLEYDCPSCGRRASVHFPAGTLHSRCPGCNAALTWEAG